MNFSNYSKKVEFTNAYYPPLKYNNPIKNSYCLDKHIIITGPNASGKSTILKTSAINIILNQQIGCGFYQNANLKLYEYIHSYINIPDTSGRDSLFQAEARRCKEIIDIIDENPKNKNHLCIFDELYSGTNPYEAVSSAISLLKYLNNNNNINFILTTHYTDLCDKLKNTKNINNFKMNVINNKNNNSFDYTYKLIEGISYIKGGSKVLKELNYPKTIVNNVLNDITI
jgi:DNA mismatch repair ATPase MutS